MYSHHKTQIWLWRARYEARGGGGGGGGGGEQHYTAKGIQIQLVYDWQLHNVIANSDLELEGIMELFFQSNENGASN